MTAVQIHSQFQSTLSARRATGYISIALSQHHLFQSTLSARRATYYKCYMLDLSSISIHALREESDPFLIFIGLISFNFNPRSPRGERPINLLSQQAQKSHFNPRSPRGERLYGILSTHKKQVFQSTLSARRATILTI